MIVFEVIPCVGCFFRNATRLSNTHTISYLGGDAILTIGAPWGDSICVVRDI